MKFAPLALSLLFVAAAGCSGGADTPSGPTNTNININCAETPKPASDTTITTNCTKDSGNVTNPEPKEAE